MVGSFDVAPITKAIFPIFRGLGMISRSKPSHREYRCKRRF
jgi:hypothetical protein